MMLRGWQWVVGGGWWFVFGSVGGAGRWAVVQTKTASGRKSVDLSTAENEENERWQRDTRGKTRKPA